jgi:hypothetical protein
MKKNILSALLCVLAASGIVFASPRGLSTVTLSADDNGDTRSPLAISCVNTGWTLVVAARPNRRMLKLHVSETAGGTICLGTGDAGMTCIDTATGVELGTGDDYQDAAEAALYCRARSAATVVKGFDMYDSRD